MMGAGCLMADMGEFWVFGYGSLMWRPGFAQVEVRRARLHGYRRVLCVKSFVHRGTEHRPGLVLGLDTGGSCIGRAFRVDDAHREDVLTYLRERELVTHVYLERVKTIRLDDGRRVDALCYVVDRHHRQYAGHLDTEEAVACVRDAVGRSGPNIDYVVNTVDHLHELGIRDHWLEGVARRLRDDQASGGVTPSSRKR